jgi:hypothetical protein
LGSAAPSVLVQQAEVAQALEQEVRALTRTAGRIANTYNGQGARQGSLYPPTETHREQMAMVEASLREAMEKLREGQRGQE